MHVFLTGGTGFIGKALVRALRAQHWDVTALVRQPGSHSARLLETWGARLVQGDITQPESLRSAMQGADVVINNAGWYEFGLHSEARQRMRTINVDGARHVIGIAHELGIPRIVHVSTMVASGHTDADLVDETFERKYPPLSVYEATKAEAHQLARAYQQQGAPVIIVSPSSVIGPGDHSALGYYARLYVRGYCLPLLPGGTRSFVHVDDCARAIALSAARGQIGEQYLFSGGTLSMQEMFAIWKQNPGGPRIMIDVPRLIGIPICIVSAPLQHLAGLPNIISIEGFVSGTFHWCYSGAKAERELGLRFRDSRQAWNDTIEVERRRARSGASWRSIDS